MSAVLLADLILYLHAVFIAIVVLSVPLIAIGGLRDWQWVHNPVYRFTHLAMIAFVAMEGLIGMTCPLTAWEDTLRNAGQGYGEKGFIAGWLSRLIFYDLPTWVFTCIYVGFAALVAGLFYLVPVRKR